MKGEADARGALSKEFGARGSDDDDDDDEVVVVLPPTLASPPPALASPLPLLSAIAPPPLPSPPSVAENNDASLSPRFSSSSFCVSYCSIWHINVVMTMLRKRK